MTKKQRQDLMRLEKAIIKTACYAEGHGLVKPMSSGDYEYFLIHMRAKLETMERYNNQLSYAMNGPYYGHQIGRAINMIDIILDEGGRCDYDERDEFMPIPESFKHYVNMKNRSRIPETDNGLSFWSDAQRLRFDKAWMLLWKILSERLMTWGD